MSLLEAPGRYELLDLVLIRLLDQIPNRVAVLFLDDVSLLIDLVDLTGLEVCVEIQTGLVGSGEEVLLVIRNLMVVVQGDRFFRRAPE